MRFKATLFALVVFVCGASAQIKLVLTFPNASSKEVFVAASLPKEPPTQSVKAEGATLDYSLGAFGGEDRIYVWDHATNNIASKAIKEISGGAWTFKKGDFNIVGKLTVRVEHRGEPVQAARVMVSSKQKKEEKLLDPSQGGELTFFGYPSGELRVKVVFNTLEKAEGSSEVIYPLALNRSEPEPVFTFAITPPVAVVSTKSPERSAPQQGDQAGTGVPKQEESSGVGKIAYVLIGLVVVAGVIYLVMQTMRKNPGAIEEKLTALGVQVPKAADPDDMPATVPAVPLAPPTPQKIVLDDAEPVPFANPASTGGSTSFAASTGEPALLRDSGERLSLAEGENLVGREDGLPLSLPGESTVSRRHASIMRAGSEVVLKDLGSTNGTFINGIRLQGETVLRAGDQVQFGSVRFRYET